MTPTSRPARALARAHATARATASPARRLVDVICPADVGTFSELYLVFEFVDTDMYKLITSPQFLTDDHVQRFFYQIVAAMHYLHSAGVMHRCAASAASAPVRFLSASTDSCAAHSHTHPHTCVQRPEAGERAGQRGLLAQGV